MRKRATINDIAYELGISKSTVSRALSGRFDVKPETKDAVMQMADKMNYKPNQCAVNLCNRRTKTIGVVVPEFLNSFFPRILMQIQDFFEQEGFHVLITQSNESAEIERKNLKLLEESMVEGILISIAHKDKNAEYYKELIGNGTPLVFFNRACTGIDTSMVLIDDYKMAFFAVEHLINSNGPVSRRRILHLKGPRDIHNSTNRYNGYRDALRKYGIEIDSSLVVECESLTRQTGYDVMTEIIKKGGKECPFDAVFGFNDQLSIGALMALKHNGYKIPQQVAIIGFSESRSALLTEPPLSSVAQPLENIGKIAARLMLDKIENPDCPNEVVILDAKLNIRESSDEKCASKNQQYRL